jgi:phosphate-selective porin
MTVATTLLLNLGAHPQEGTIIMENLASNQLGVFMELADFYINIFSNTHTHTQQQHSSVKTA